MVSWLEKNDILVYNAVKWSLQRFADKSELLEAAISNWQHSSTRCFPESSIRPGNAFQTICTLDFGDNIHMSYKKKNKKFGNP